MSLELFHRTYIASFTKKMVQKILNPKSAGIINSSDIDSSMMRVVIGEEGSHEEKQHVKIYIVVDEQDGVIADMKYQLFGSAVMVATLEALVELSLRKNYMQASRLTYEFIDRHLRDHFDQPGIPIECFSQVNFILSAFYQALDACQEIPIAQDQTPPPNPIDHESAIEHRYPNFLELTQDEKMHVVEEVVKQDIRPYVQLDEGNVIIKKIDGYKITIVYQGSCTSCFSATGSTLNAIQQILRAKINPHITVIPEL